MKNTEYKCMCCGWLGNEENSAIDASLTQKNIEVCPQCGSMDIQELMQIEDLSV